MIREGKQGSYNLFYNNLFISSYPIHNKKMIHGYNNQGIELIEQSLRLNKSLKQQIIIYKMFCNLIYNKKKNKEKICTGDHIYFLNCFLALMKLNIIKEDNENGILIMGKKKCRLK